MSRYELACITEIKMNKGLFGFGIIGRQSEFSKRVHVLLRSDEAIGMTSTNWAQGYRWIRLGIDDVDDIPRCILIYSM